MSDALPRCPVCGVWKGNVRSRTRWSLLATHRDALGEEVDEKPAALPCNTHICHKCYKLALTE